MTIDLIKKARKIDKSCLSPPQKSVLICMLGFSNKAGEDIFPRLKTIESQTSLSRRTVQRAIHHLVKTGLLIKIKSFVPERHLSNSYKANLGLLNELTKVII